jgi:arylsulfatase A-like enzyme
MSRARCAQAGAVILLVATLSGCTPDNDDAGDVGVRPNLLVIVADDLGINDVGVYGNATVETPHIDRLAADGMRFTRFYTAGDVCAPTRASLTTGLYPQRLGYRRAVRGISSEVVTLPELLRLSGYATHHIGKWHLGDSPREARPRAQGYDTFFGFLDQLFLKPPRPNGSPGQPTYHDPLLMEDDSDPVAHAGHLTDLLTAAAVERIQATSDGSPWLLTLWYYAPHAPSQPPLRSVGESLSEYA